MSPVGRRGAIWLPVRFAAASLEAGPSTDPFEIAVGQGRIEVRGLLTAVGRAWRLGATATCRRRRIALNVTATEHMEGGAATVRQYRYDAVLEGLPPGSYSLRVSHVYGIGSGGYIGLGVPAYGRALLVP